MPRIGPMMKASPQTAPMSPSTEPRFSSGKDSPTTALATGNMPPAPNPCKARAARMKPKEGARATPMEPMPKRATAVLNTARLPKRSESLARSGVPMTLNKM